MLLIEKIREATKPMHEALDASLTPCIAGIRSADDYGKLLIAFYGFFQPVYGKIDAHLQTSLLPDYPMRRKPNDILKNLSLLSCHYPANNLCYHLPVINNNAGAFGALYVMEGSTLGGLIIKKMLADQTGLKDEQLSFFAGYGKETRGKWNLFITALNNISENETEEQITIHTAAETFSRFKDWLIAAYL